MLLARISGLLNGLTEILANQHFIGLSELANELNTIKYLQVQPRHLLEKSFMKSWKTAILLLLRITRRQSEISEFRVSRD
jgi:hypothetical protein